MIFGLYVRLIWRLGRNGGSAAGCPKAEVEVYLGWFEDSLGANRAIGGRCGEAERWISPCWRFAEDFLHLAGRENW